MAYPGSSLLIQGGLAFLGQMRLHVGVGRIGTLHKGYQPEGMQVFQIGIRGLIAHHFSPADRIEKIHVMIT